MVDMCAIAEWHLVTGTIWLPDISSSNRMPRLRDYIYIVPTIRLPNEMSGNQMVGKESHNLAIRLPDK